MEASDASRLYLNQTHLCRLFPRVVDLLVGDKTLAHVIGSMRVDLVLVENVKRRLHVYILQFQCSLTM